MFATRQQRFLTNVAALQVSGSAPSFSTWNPADKAATITLGLSNTQASTTTGIWGAARGTLGRSTGKYYFELSLSGASASGTNLAIGIGTASASLTNSLGGDAFGYGAYTPSGQINNNNSSILGGAAWPSTACVGAIAVDLGANLVWFWNPAQSEWNSNGSADPATGVSGVSITAGTYFPMMSESSGTALFVVLNTGASAFNYSIPSGFSAWG